MRFGDPHENAARGVRLRLEFYRIALRSSNCKARPVRLNMEAYCRGRLADGDSDPRLNLGERSQCGLIALGSSKPGCHSLFTVFLPQPGVALAAHVRIEITVLQQ